jgi:hypothetical protein
MVPGDAVIARRVEAAVVDRETHLVVRVADQPAIPGETGEDREIALGHAERHVDPGGISPLGDDTAAAQHEAVGTAAGPHRPERLVPWRTLLEIAGNHLGEVSAPWRLAFGGVARCGA